jgi:hypothetical protein
LLFDGLRLCSPVVELPVKAISLCNITEKHGYMGVIGSANATKYEF